MPPPQTANIGHGELLRQRRVRDHADSPPLPRSAPPATGRDCGGALVRADPAEFWVDQPANLVIFPWVSQGDKGGGSRPGTQARFSASEALDSTPRRASPEPASVTYSERSLREHGLVCVVAGPLTRSGRRPTPGPGP